MVKITKVKPISTTKCTISFFGEESERRFSGYLLCSKNGKNLWKTLLFRGRYPNDSESTSLLWIYLESLKSSGEFIVGVDNKGQTYRLHSATGKMTDPPTPISYYTNQP